MWFWVTSTFVYSLYAGFLSSVGNTPEPFSRAGLRRRRLQAQSLLQKRSASWRTLRPPALAASCQGKQVTTERFQNRACVGGGDSACTSIHQISPPYMNDKIILKRSKYRNMSLFDHHIVQSQFSLHGKSWERYSFPLHTSSTKGQPENPASSTFKINQR